MNAFENVRTTMTIASMITGKAGPRVVATTGAR